MHMSLRCLALGALLAGCTGTIGSDGTFSAQHGSTGHDPDDPSKRDGGPNGSDPGPLDESCDAEYASDVAPARLLSRSQYNNTVADLFGAGMAPMTIDVGSGEGVFDNAAAGLVSNERLIEFYKNAAKDIATQAFATGLNTGCSDAMADSECADAFVATWGRRVFRGQLSDADSTLLRTLFDTLRSDAVGDDRAAALQGVLTAMLQMPAFLYRIEVGEPVGGGVSKLTGVEMASRLSYYLWHSTPDDMLLDAAEAGDLDTEEGVLTQATRLLDSDKAKSAIADFHSQWLQIGGLELIGRDPVLYPSYTPELGRTMRDSTVAFLQELLDEGGTVRDAYASDFAYVNDALAPVYGMAAGMGAELTRVSVNTAERSGLLTQPSVLASHSKSDRSSPISRGVFVVRRVLCQALGDPPMNVPPLEEQQEFADTVRGQLELHSMNPCASCHKYIDPAGLPFEQYDAIGAFQSMDAQGNPIDVSGGLVTPKVDMPVEGGVGLSELIADYEDTEKCMVQQWMTYALARAPDTTQDRCTLDQLHQSLAEGGYRLRDIVLGVTTTDQFRYRRTSVVEGVCP